MRRYLKPLGVVLQEELREELEQYAAAHGLSLAAVVRRSLLLMLREEQRRDTGVTLYQRRDAPSAAVPDPREVELVLSDPLAWARLCIVYKRNGQTDYVRNVETVAAHLGEKPVEELIETAHWVYVDHVRTRGNGKERP